MPSNPNATAIAKKYYCGGKGSIGLTVRRRSRRRRRRKKAVPRAAAGYAWQLKKSKILFTHERLQMELYSVTVVIHSGLLVDAKQVIVCNFTAQFIIA